MTLNASYIGANAYENSVDTDRVLLQHMVLGSLDRSGCTSGSFRVTTVPGMHQVTVGRYVSSTGPGISRAFLVGKNTLYSQGAYFAWSDADETLDLPNPLSSPFIATIILRVTDPQFGTVVGAVGARLDILTGTPATTPTPLSDVAIDALGVPGGWIRLADVRINTADTGSVPQSQITDTRPSFGDRAGDPILCSSSDRPPHVRGRVILETDTDAWGISAANSWNMYDTRSQSYTPGLGGVTLGNGTLGARYFRQGDYLDISLTMQLGTTSSITGNITIALPPTMQAANGHYQVGSAVINDASTGFDYSGSARIAPGGTTITLPLYGSLVAGIGRPMAWASGDYIAINIRLEIQN